MSGDATGTVLVVFGLLGLGLLWQAFQGKQRREDEAIAALPPERRAHVRARGRRALLILLAVTVAVTIAAAMVGAG